MVDEAGAFADKSEVRKAIDAWLVSPEPKRQARAQIAESSDSQWGTSEEAQREMMKATEF